MLQVSSSFGIICGTALVATFHASIVNLAKLFLDPLNNEVDMRGGARGIGGIEVATLLQETNIGSERWRKSSAWVPQAVWRPPLVPPPVEDAASAEPSLMSRIFGTAVDEPPTTNERRLASTEGYYAGSEQSTSADDSSSSADV